MNESHGLIRKNGAPIRLEARKLEKNLKKIVSPLIVKFRLKDIVEILVGAALLSIPVSYTEETWRLGETLPVRSIVGIALLSLLLISVFSYYNYYRTKLEHHFFEFLKRVIFTYILSILVVSMILTLIMQAPWGSDLILALKRVIIVSFPASMSATLADTIR